MVEINETEFNKMRHKYCKTIEKIVPELKRELKGKETITMVRKDFAKKVGPTYGSWSARYCLFDKGIIIHDVEKVDEPVCIIRARTPEDFLPHTVKEYIERRIIHGTISI